MAEENKDYYWDYVSVQEVAEPNESVRDLMREQFEFTRTLLDAVFWVDSTCLYLNYVCTAPQASVAKLLGISQTGVSKRVRSAVKKISIILKKPESDLNQVRSDLSLFFNFHHVELLCLYYNLASFSVVSKVVNYEKTGTIRVRILTTLAKLNQIASELSDAKTEDEIRSVLGVYLNTDSLSSDDLHRIVTFTYRYAEYFAVLVSVNSYSTHQFKKFDDMRNADEPAPDVSLVQIKLG